MKEGTSVVITVPHMPRGTPFHCYPHADTRLSAMSIASFVEPAHHALQHSSAHADFVGHTCARHFVPTHCTSVKQTPWAVLQREWTLAPALPVLLAHCARGRLVKAFLQMEGPTCWQKTDAACSMPHVCAMPLSCMHACISGCMPENGASTASGTCAVLSYLFCSRDHHVKAAYEDSAVSSTQAQAFRTFFGCSICC